jgi:hypothetical protein
MKSPHFKEFLAVLKALSEVCNDLHFVDGKVLQTSNDRTSIIGFDLSNIFEIKGTYIIVDIKKVMKNLDVLNKSRPIIFKLTDETMQISDRTNYIDLKVCPEKFCDNKKMTEDYCRSIYFDRIKLLEFSLSKDLCVSITKLCWLNNSNKLEICIAHNQATLAVPPVDEALVRPSFKFDYKLHKSMDYCRLIFSPLALQFKRPMTFILELDEANPVAYWKAKVTITENVSFDLYGRASVFLNPN